MARNWPRDDRKALEELGVYISLAIQADSDQQIAASLEDEDGYIGRFYGTGKAILTLVVDDGKRRVFPFYIEGGAGEQEVALARDRSNLVASILAEGQRYFEAKMQIKLSSDIIAVSHTEFPDNNIRVLLIGEGGEYRSFVIALVSQRGQFFLIVQEAYQGKFFRDGDQIVCPEFPDGKMAALMTSRLPLTELSNVGEYKKPQKASLAGLTNRTGRVLWWSAAEQVGAVLTVEYQGRRPIPVVARVHWKQIVGQHSPNDMAYLSPGQLVQFDQIGHPVQTKARGTTFKRELSGVKPGIIPSFGR